MHPDEKRPWNRALFSAMVSVTECSGMFGLKGASSSPVLPIKNDSLSDRFLTLLIVCLFSSNVSL
jgi:hypothetical protein